MKRSAKGFASLLMRVYPEHYWDVDKLLKQRPIKSSQRMLYKILLELFPNEGRKAKLANVCDIPRCKRGI